MLPDGSKSERDYSKAIERITGFPHPPLVLDVREPRELIVDGADQRIDSHPDDADSNRRRAPRIG